MLAGERFRGPWDVQQAKEMNQREDVLRQSTASRVSNRYEDVEDEVESPSSSYDKVSTCSQGKLTLMNAVALFPAPRQKDCTFPLMHFESWKTSGSAKILKQAICSSRSDMADAPLLLEAETVVDRFRSFVNMLSGPHQCSQCLMSAEHF